MGTCLSKKKGSSTSSPLAGAKSVSTAPTQQKNSAGNGVTAALSKPEISIKKNTVQEKQDPEVVKEKEEEGQVKKEIFIIKHRKSHDDRERSSKIPSCTAQHNVAAQPADGLASPGASATSDSGSAESSMGNKVALAPSTPNMGVVGVRTSSCTKEEVDAILIQCGRLSRSSSGKAASSSAGGRKYSGSKRSYDFDHCDNDAISAEDDQKRANASDNSEEYDGVAAAENRRRGHHQHRQRHRQSPRRGSSPSSSQGRRRTPSRERDQQQQQRSSSRERRVSRSPGRRSSETNNNNTNTSTANASNNNNTGSTRPGKMVSVPATVSSLVMDKSNNGGGGESAGIKRVTVKRNGGDNNGMVGSRGAASPRSQSPARANGNAAANAKVLSENQQQPSLSRNNSSRKTEQSPYRRNPLSEVDPNCLAYPQSNTNNGTSKVQNKPKRGIEADANQKPNVDMNDNSRSRTKSRVALEKGVTVGVNCHTKEEQEEEIKVMSSVPDNAVVKTMVVPSGGDNLKTQTLTRSRSCRRSRDFDINPEALLNPTQTYASLLLEDIQNFHQKNTQPSVSLPGCLTKACSILEAVADLNSTTSSNFSGAFSEDRKSPPPTCQSIRNEYNAVHYGKRVADTTDPFVESEVVVSDDVMEPSLHKYVTVKRGGSLVGGVDMEDQESSGSNSFTVSSGQQHWGISSSSWEPSSADSTDCWTSRLDSRDEGQKSPLGLDGCLSSETNKKTLNNSKRREYDHQHSSGIGRGRLGSNSSLPVVTAAAST